MKKMIFAILCSIVISFNAFAQNTYEKIKTKAVENLREGDFIAAKSRLNLMEPYVKKSKKTEYQSLLDQLQDSINNSYNKANALREKKQYELAIIEYQRLIGKDREPLVKPLYAHIGYCYEMRYDKELAKNSYQLGIQHDENLASLRMAWYIRKNKISVTTEEMIGFYERASNYYAAMDSLGVEYARLGDMNQSYKWFKESMQDFSMYKMASYLLDESIYDKLHAEYKNDDPIKLLSDSADDGYAPAQYYLGLLYYFANNGERVSRDRVKGLEYMQKSANNGYERAKTMIEKIKHK